MKQLIVFVLLACVSLAAAAKSREFKSLLADAVAKQAQRGSPRSESAFYASYTPGLPGGFKCPLIQPSAAVPTNARQVRISDIQVVGALGDSLTAANGAKAWTAPGVLKQYRGISWSAGGDNDINKVLTVPNILKKYNSNLAGFSTGSSYSEDYKGAKYNVAKAGNTAADLVDQARDIVQKVKADNNQNKWKVITIFIGGNDVCKYCEDKDLLSPANYKTNVQSAVDIIYENFNNTIVNLLGPLDLSEVTSLPDGFSCRAVHKTVCGCAYNKTDPGYAGRMSREYQQKIKEVVSEAPKRWTRLDFGVSYHPQYVESKLPTVNGEIDLSFFAPDCFHFSQYGHEIAAVALWNNMLKPVEERATALQYDSRTLDCPSEASPYIYI